MSWEINSKRIRCCPPQRIGVRLVQTHHGSSGCPAGFLALSTNWHSPPGAPPTGLPARNHILGSILYYPKKRVSRCCPRYVLVVYQCSAGVTVTRIPLFFIPPSTTLKWLRGWGGGWDIACLGSAICWDVPPLQSTLLFMSFTIRWTTKVVLYRVAAFHVLYFCIDVEPSPPTARERLRACLLPTHFRESTYLRGRIPACDERANWPADISMSSRKEGARE